MPDPTYRVRRPPRNRLIGHALYREGAPCDDDGNSIATQVPGFTKPYELRGGEGRASCSCGAVSEILPSSYKRRLWHRDHKDEIRQALGISA